VELTPFAPERALGWGPRGCLLQSLREGGELSLRAFYGRQLFEFEISIASIATVQRQGMIGAEAEAEKVSERERRGVRT
jgi:hypothetical protein